jgi:hypothetical protein
LGIGFVLDLVALVDWGVEGKGEKDLSDKGVVGDVAPPPQPKKEPSFDPAGDLGSDFWIVELESLDSFVDVRDIAVGELSLCCGKGLDEKRDMVDWAWLVVLESLFHVLLDSEADVCVESTVNLAFFAARAS